MPWGMIAAQHVRACMLRTPEPRIAVVATGVACIRTLDRLCLPSLSLLRLHNFPAQRHQPHHTPPSLEDGTS